MYRIILIPCKICPLPYFAVSVFHACLFAVAIIVGLVVWQLVDLRDGLVSGLALGLATWAHMMFVKDQLIAAAWKELESKNGETGEE